jgi:hypothetical protein
MRKGHLNVGALSPRFAVGDPPILCYDVDQDGTRWFRRLETAPLDAAPDWIARYRDLWESRFQRLDTALDELKAARRSE